MLALLLSPEKDLVDLTVERLQEIYAQLDAKEFSFTDADADSMAAIRQELRKRRTMNDWFDVVVKGNVPRQFDGTHTVLTLGYEQAKKLLGDLNGFKQVFDPEPVLSIDSSDPGDEYK